MLPWLVSSATPADDQFTYPFATMRDSAGRGNPVRAVTRSRDGSFCETLGLSENPLRESLISAAE
jgi:hypothetical protein